MTASRLLMALREVVVVAAENSVSQKEVRMMRTIGKVCASLVLACLLGACGSSDPVTPERFATVDALVEKVSANLSVSGMRLVADIDHARLGAEAGSPMPPARVMIFSDPELESRLMALHPLVGVDLPLRVLSYEAVEEGAAKVIVNNFDYIVSRYGLDPSLTRALRSSYDNALQTALAAIPENTRASFETDVMDPDGLITITSPYDFDETLERVNAAIDSQGDTMQFGVFDYQASAQELGIELPPATLILFGGPGPGGKAMAGAPTLGLDAFCQKFLVWQDAEGTTHLSYNDLLALAERQQVGKSIPLRVINFRLNKVFGEALERD